MLLALYQIETGHELFKASESAAAGPRAAPEPPAGSGQPKAGRSNLKAGQSLKPSSLDAIERLRNLRGGL